MNLLRHLVDWIGHPDSPRWRLSVDDWRAVLRDGIVAAAAALLTVAVNRFLPLAAEGRATALDAVLFVVWVTTLNALRKWTADCRW